MDLIRSTIKNRENRRFSALELIIELLPPLIINLRMTCLLGFLIKLTDWPVSLRQ